MFLPNWPPSSVQVKDFAAHCNADFFHSIVVASGYFVHGGCKWLLFVSFGLLIVTALSVLAGAGVLLCAGLVS
jgi:hypothetical protein